ncbi:MAG: hypothetical protein ACPHCN_18100 [Mycobacterium sp.]
MNQIRYLAQGLTWPGDGSRVVGTVGISPAPPSAFLAAGAEMPAVTMQPGSARSDDDEPDLQRQSIALAVSVSAPSDAIAEGAMMGAGRIDPDDGGGRGLFEVVPRLVEAITGTGAVGVKLTMRQTGRRGVEQSDLGYVLTTTFDIQAECTTVRTYQDASRFVATGGSGTVSLSWRLPGLRFDTLRVILRRASGSTAPASPSAGTGVTLGSDLATSVTDTVAAGTYSYALLVAYDDNPSAATQFNWEARGTPSVDRSYSDGVAALSVSVS